MVESTEDRWHGIVNEFYDAKTDADGVAWRMADLALEWATNPPQNLPIKWRPRYWRGLSADVGFTPKTLMEWALTAHTFPMGERKFPDEYLTFEHHRICAVVPPMQPTMTPRLVADIWLARAADNNWSTAQLRREIAAETKPTKPGKCIHASPAIRCAWQGKAVEAQECERCGYREAPKCTAENRKENE